MKCVAVVPMKLNNRRLPGKNTKSFTNGEPLCHYILSTLKKLPCLDEIFVYCSDPAIQSFIPQGVRYLERPKSLDQDSTKINEVLLSFAKEVDADCYLMTHATSPFISTESLIKGVELVMSGKYDSSFAARKIQDFLWEDGRPFNYSLDSIPRTQDLKPLFVETSGFYCYRHDVIINKNRRSGDNPAIVEVSSIEAIDIDEYECYKSGSTTRS